MPGKIKHMIETIILERSKGIPTIASTTRTKLRLKGIEPANFTADSPDDPDVINRLREIAKEFNIFNWGFAVPRYMSDMD